MCGICGYIDYKGKIEDHVLEKMVCSIRHRGPDDRGCDFYYLPQAKIALGHARLSILDLSQAGHQPMLFDNLTIVFNGEIYNFKEIRQELIDKGHQFKSNSDTEVILHSFKEWHTECVDRFIGMFAFAIFDKTERKLFLCRDRAGVKPLYYHIDKDYIAFASELKPLIAIPQFKKQLSNKAISTFLKTGFIPGEMCIFENTYKLDGGCWAEYDIEIRKLKKWRYWDIADFYSKPKLNVSYEDAKEEIKQLFKSAFGYRLVSDVPIGVLLSGGFDSAAVTAILTKELGTKLKTYTIGFRDYIDEAPDAEKISEILGTEQTTHYCSKKDIKELVYKLPQVYDEPFSDPSALPSILVSMIVRKSVPVILSADGGDEIFAGYDTYERISVFYPNLEKIPSFLRNHLHKPINAVEKLVPSKSSRTHNFLLMVDETLNSGELSYKIWYDNAFVLSQNIVNSIFPLLRQYDYREVYKSICINAHSPEYALLADWKTKMKDKYLVKVDRAMMSVSLEGREPLLDHRIAEYVAQLPWDYKYKNSEKKRILKDIVYDYLPKELMDKPKRGFMPPLYKWMRDDMQDYVRNRIDDFNLLGLEFNRNALNQTVDRFMGGEYYLWYDVWKIVQLSAWYQEYMNSEN